jgi:hypothetical protein
VTLDADDVEAIARRVAELVPPPSRWVDAQAVAAALGVDRDWVYAHARALGVVRLGPGPKSRMRFDLALVRERVAALPRSTRRLRPSRGHGSDACDSQRHRA